MRIYTAAYRPFVMGGRVNYFICTEVSATESVELGRGVWVRLVTTPRGETRVIESSTGAIVGNTLEEVRADFASAEPDVVSKQIEQARIDSEEAEYLTPEEFWNRLKQGRLAVRDSSR